MECEWCLGTGEAYNPPQEFFDVAADAMIFYLGVFDESWYNCHHIPRLPVS